MIRNEELLREHLIGCAREVFAAYDVSVDSDAAGASSSQGPRLASIIRFDGEEMQGELAFVAPVSLIRSSYPVPGPSDQVTDEDVADWAAEVANQLLGSLKRKLLMNGTEIRLSLPKTMPAERLRRGDSAIPEACAVSLRAGSLGYPLFELRLDATILESVNLASRPPVGDLSIEPGVGCLLF